MDISGWMVRSFAVWEAVRVLSRRQAFRTLSWELVMLYWAKVEGAWRKYWDVIITEAV